MSVRILVLYLRGRLMGQRVRWLGGPSDGEYLNLLPSETEFFTMYELIPVKQGKVWTGVTYVKMYEVPIRNGKLHYYERKEVK